MQITKVLDKGKLETILGLLATAVSFTRKLTFRFFSFCRISNMSVFRVLNWVPLETLHLLMGQTITSFSDSLKQTPIDVTTWGSFLIASFKDGALGLNFHYYLKARCVCLRGFVTCCQNRVCTIVVFVKGVLISFISFQDVCSDNSFHLILTMAIMDYLKVHKMNWMCKK